MNHSHLTSIYLPNICSFLKPHLEGLDCALAGGPRQGGLSQVERRLAKQEVAGSMLVGLVASYL